MPTLRLGTYASIVALFAILQFGCKARESSLSGPQGAGANATGPCNTAVAEAVRDPSSFLDAATVVQDPTFVPIRGFVEASLLSGNKTTPQQVVQQEQLGPGETYDPELATAYTKAVEGGKATCCGNLKVSSNALFDMAASKLVAAPPQVFHESVEGNQYGLAANSKAANAKHAVHARAATKLSSKSELAASMGVFLKNVGQYEANQMVAAKDQATKQKHATAAVAAAKRARDILFKHAAKGKEGELRKIVQNNFAMLATILSGAGFNAESNQLFDAARAVGGGDTADQAIVIATVHGFEEYVTPQMGLAASRLALATIATQARLVKQIPKAAVFADNMGKIQLTEVKAGAPAEAGAERIPQVEIKVPQAMLESLEIKTPAGAAGRASIPLSEVGIEVFKVPHPSMEVGRAVVEIPAFRGR